MSYIRYDLHLATRVKSTVFCASHRGGDTFKTNYAQPHNTAPDNNASHSGGAGVSTPAFSPLYQQIKGLILQSLEAGEWRPEN
jgi:hypothetical protein